MSDLTPAFEGAPPSHNESFVDKLRNALLAAYRSPAFWPGVAVALGFTACYWTLFGSLWRLWDSPDGYYSHGYLVPFISGYIVYRWWPRLSKIQIKPSWIALVLILLDPPQTLREVRLGFVHIQSDHKLSLRRDHNSASDRISASASSAKPLRPLREIGEI